jgi:hypothetical protein
MAHVNVDQEGELRTLHNVTTYPQLHVLTGQTKAAAHAASRHAKLGSRRPAASPSEPFGGSAATAADVAAHAASAYAWASHQPFALLAAPDGDQVAGGAAARWSKTDSASAFAGLALAVDAALVSGAAAAASKPPPEDDEPSFGEVHKRVVAVLVVLPDEALLSAQTSSSAAAVSVGLQVAELVGGGHVFVGSGGGAACAAAAKALLVDADATAAAEGGAAAAVAAAAAACAEFGQPSSASGGGVVVVHPSDGAVLARRLPPPGPAGAELGSKAVTPSARVAVAAAAEQADVAEGGDTASGGMAAWLRAAAWPALSRFSTSAEQGERIRKSGVSADEARARGACRARRHLPLLPST